MLSEKNYEQHVSNLNYIDNYEIRDVYCFMLGHAACLSKYECFPNKPAQENYKRDFQYHTNGYQPFAFIINKDSILFYFRKSSSLIVDKITVESTFPDINTNNNEEMTIRIKNIVHAKKS